MKDAFLMGKFEVGEEIFMEVPQGIKHHYWVSAVLRLLKPIYRLKQAAKTFWQKIVGIMKSMRHKQSMLTHACISPGTKMENWQYG